MMNCNIDIEYPEIKVERKNKEYAYYLLEDYAGVTSELTAITLYVYGHIINKETNKELSKTLKGIFISEMHHLEILGSLIKLLGVKPVYKTINNNTLTPWNSNYVNYETDPVKSLLFNIESEVKAIKQYKEHIELIDDIYIKKILERIILDEIEHIKCFNKLLEKIKNKR